MADHSRAYEVRIAVVTGLLPSDVVLVDELTMDLPA